MLASIVFWTGVSIVISGVSTLALNIWEAAHSPPDANEHKLAVARANSGLWIAVTGELTIVISWWPQ